MSSTQHSESMNYIVKKYHVDANTPLHLFAKQMMKFIHRRKMDEARETYGCMVCVNFCAYVIMHLVVCFYAHYVTILNCVVKVSMHLMLLSSFHPPVSMFLCTLCCWFLNCIVKLSMHLLFCTLSKLRVIRNLNVHMTDLYIIVFQLLGG
jgi:hypothetical protein